MRRRLAALMALVMVLTSISFPSFTAFAEKSQGEVASSSDFYFVVEGNKVSEVTLQVGNKLVIGADKSQSAPYVSDYKIEILLDQGETEYPFKYIEGDVEKTTSQRGWGGNNNNIRMLGKSEGDATLKITAYGSDDDGHQTVGTAEVRVHVTELRVIPNSSNIDEKYLKQTEVSTEGTITVTYSFDKENVKKDIAQILKDGQKYFNVVTDIKAPDSATDWQVGQRSGKVSDGYAHLGVTVYDNSGTEGHFTDDKLTGALEWYKGGTKLSEEQVNITWEEYKESGEYCFKNTEQKVINEAKVQLEHSFHVSLERVQSGGNAPDHFTLEMIRDGGQGSYKALIEEGQDKVTSVTREWTNGREINIYGNAEGDITLRATIYDNESHEIGSTELRVIVEDEEAKDATLPALTEGKLHISDHNMGLKIVGWDYDNWTDDKYFVDLTHKEPVILERGEDGSQNLSINISDEGWRALYETAEAGQTKLFIDMWPSEVPQDTKYYAFSGHNNPFLVEDQTQREKQIDATCKAMYGRTSYYEIVSEKTVRKRCMRGGLAEIVTVGGKTVIKPGTTEDLLLTWIWRGPAEEYAPHDFGNGEIIECWPVTMKQLNQNSTILIGRTGKLQETDIKKDEAGLGSSYVNTTWYQSNALIYYLNSNTIKADKPTTELVTTVKAPAGADAVSVSADRGFINVTTNADHSVTFSCLVNDQQMIDEIKHRMDFTITWQKNGVSVKYPFAIGLIYEDSLDTPANYGFSHVDFSRLKPNEDLSGKYGFTVEKSNIADEDLRVKFTTSSINFDADAINPAFTVTAPVVDGKVIRKALAFPMPGFSRTVAKDTMQNVIDMMNTRTDTVDVTAGVLEVGIDNDIIPSCYTLTVGDYTQKVYYQPSLTRQGFYKATHDYFIQWYAYDPEDTACSGTPTLIREYYRFNQGVDMDAASYGGSIPSSDQEILVEYFPQSGSGDEDIKAEYWRISPGGLETGDVTFVIPYPNTAAKSAAMNSGKIKLLHYSDDSHTSYNEVECIATEEGLVVTTSEFSPFMVLWYGQESKKKESDDDNRGSSSTPVVKPDQAVTPIKTAEDGKQLIGTTTISLPASKLTEEEKKSYVETGKWDKDKYGRWQLKDAAGSLFKSCWALVSDKLCSKSVGNASWYFFDANGYMLTGWQQIPGADGKKYWYYFNKEDGSMYGACLMNGTTPDGLKVNEKGQRVDTDGKPVTN